MRAGRCGARGSAPADGAETGLRLSVPLRTAPGVEYREFDIAASLGRAHGHLLSVDLRNPKVSVDLLYPGAVGARARVSAMARARGAVGAVDGDFFNITETQHPGIKATGAPVGPAIAGGRVLKAAVPDGRRFGPALPPRTITRDVIGVGIANGGRRLLLALDGGPAYRTGLTLAELAQVMRSLGSRDAFSLDGGGSSTLVARLPGVTALGVVNHPSGGAERAVPNGIGVFSWG
ncbi:hypothetical protein GCM10020367_66700 [Streptomyces sannanensis]|uniref:Phosphodiester glycosidase domain-containing protein n=1 Tax=Streptomyces sannanensis TaxID=285536 RepID=A0ABP6SMQ3_9ACTN